MSHLVCTPREAYAYIAHKSLGLSYARIAAKLGCSSARARQLYGQAERKEMRGAPDLMEPAAPRLVPLPCCPRCGADAWDDADAIIKTHPVGDRLDVYDSHVALNTAISVYRARCLCCGATYASPDLATLVHDGKKDRWSP